MWYALNILSTNITMKYAMNNQEKGKDFRRPLFEKEKKIFALFGEDFLKGKMKRLMKYLKKIRIMIFNYGYTLGLQNP